MTPDETPTTTPPELAEAEAQLAADEQEWLTLTDEAFDALMQEGDGGLSVGGV